MTKMHVPGIKKGPVAAPVVPPPAPSSTYSTLMGTGVDATGYALLPLRSGASAFYVDPLLGNDSNPGTSASPLLTKAAAKAKIVSGRGDHILVAEGRTSSEALPNLSGLNGYDAQYPLVIQSYNPAAPADETQWGRGYVRGARPVLSATSHGISGSVGLFTPNFIAIRGFDFSSNNVSGRQLRGLADNNIAGSYWLIEGNLLHQTAINFDMIIGSDLPPRTNLTDTLIIRNNSSHGNWDSLQQVGSAVYAAGWKGYIVIEYNTIVHGGWNESKSRSDTDYSTGAANIYKHTLYLQTTNDAYIIDHHNIYTDGAADAGQHRSPHEVTDNLYIDNPISMTGGGGTAYSTYQPNGVHSEFGYNAVLGDSDITTAEPQGTGVILSNGTAGSVVHHNLLARARNPASATGSTFVVDALFDVPSIHDIHSNVTYLWNSSNVFGGAGNYPGQRKASYENNYTDGPAFGTNLNISSLSAPNPYTAAQFYTAMLASFPSIGSATKAAFLARALAYPEEHMQDTAVPTLFTGYGVPLVCADLRLSASFVVGVASTVRINGVTPGSTLTAALPAGFTLDSANRTISYNGSGSATVGTFAITETPVSRITGGAKINSVAYMVLTNAPTALNPADKSANITLSNNNLTATAPSSLAAVRAARAFGAGNYYWEWTVNVNADVNAGAVADSSANLNDTTYWALAANTHAASQFGTGMRYNTTTQTVTSPVYVRGAAYNGTLNKWFFRDATGWLNGDPVAGTGGLSLTGMGASKFAAWQGDGGDKATFNFDPIACVYPFPTGYGAI